MLEGLGPGVPNLF